MRSAGTHPLSAKDRGAQQCGDELRRAVPGESAECGAVVQSHVATATADAAHVLEGRQGARRTEGCGMRHVPLSVQKGFL